MPHSFYLLLASISILGISACSPINTQPASTLHNSAEAESESIGWTVAACLAIKNASLQPNQTIWWLETNQSGAARALTVVMPSSDPAVCPALSPDRAETNHANGYSFYEVASNQALDLGIAFVEQAASAQYAATSCVTSEGIAFDAQPLPGAQQQAWRGYYYLGYDTENTCVE